MRHGLSGDRSRCASTSADTVTRGPAMADPRFYRRAGPFSLAEIATRIGAQLADHPMAHELAITDIAPLDEAEPGHLSLFAEPSHRPAFEATRAGAVLTSRSLAAAAPTDARGLMFSEAPRLHFTAIARLFYPTFPPNDVSAGSATIGPDCRV